MNEQLRTRPTMTIVTPGDWVRLEVERLSAEELTERVDALVAERPELSQQRDELLSLLGTFVDASRAAGVVLVAMMVDVADRPVLPASLTVAVPDLPAPDEGDVIQALARELEGAPSASSRNRTVEVVELTAGAAVRLEETQEVETGDGEGILLLHVEYHVPAGDGSVAVLSFSTSYVALAETFRGLFDAMARSFLIDG